MQRLFSSTPRTILKPAWRYRVDGYLWLFRMNAGGRIAGETRHQERREASYFCLDERTGRVLWERVHLDEPWWVGLEDLDDTRVYLHRYRKPDMPQHLGVTAVDCETGRVAWEKPDVIFQFVDRGLVYVARQGLEAMRYLALHAEDGSLHRDFGADADAIRILRAALNEEDRFAGYQYPEPFSELHPEYDALRDLTLEWCAPAARRGAFDILRHGTVVLASWHQAEKRGEGLSQEFLAYDTARAAVVYAETMNAGVAQPAIDSFLVKDGRILYVKDKDTLTALPLTVD
jgi:hypothetical protein